MKTLDELGIGRPSTYAAVISTIMDRGYVQVRSGSLVPSWTAFSVVRLLENSFGPYVNYEFTRRWKKTLTVLPAARSHVWSGWVPFYFGGGGAEETRAQADCG